MMNGGLKSSATSLVTGGASINSGWGRIRPMAGNNNLSQKKI